MTTRISLPPTVRTIWASAAARAEWEPKIQRAASAWHRVERESVRHGLRIGAQQWISKEDYLELLAWAMNEKIKVRVVRWTGSTGGFLHTGYPEGKDQVVVAFGRCDPDRLQKPEVLFGYPPCCIDHFEREFPKDADPVPAWAKSKALPVIEPWARTTATTYRLKVVLPEQNPLLRYIGVRATPHIPCSPECLKSLRDGNAYLQLMEYTGDGSGAQETHDLLSLPCTWDRYRGVAIIRTPHFQVISTSSFFPHREVIHVTQD